MSQSPETKDIESEATTKSDESASIVEDFDEEHSSTSVENDTAVKSTEFKENKVDSKETNQDKVSSEETNQESNQQSIEPEKTSKEKLEPSPKSSKEPIQIPKSSQEQVKIPESGQNKIEIPESSQIDVASENKENPHASRRFQMSDSIIRQIFFQFNPEYLIQMRGMTNLLHIIFSLSDIILLGLNCQLRPYPHSPSEGFYCKPPETFFFVVACSSFIIATLYLFTCVSSKATDSLLFHSSFEVNYFVLYFIMLLTASLTLIVSEMNWGSYNGFYERDYESSQVAAIIGLINCITYGISAIGYFMSHRLLRKDIIGRNQL